MENTLLQPPDDNLFQRLLAELEALRPYLPKGYASQVQQSLSEQGHHFKTSNIYKVASGKVYNLIILEAILKRASQEKTRLQEVYDRIRKITNEE